MNKFLIVLFSKFTTTIKKFSRFHRLKLWCARLFLSNYERHLITEALAELRRRKFSAMGETANEDGKYCITLYHYLLTDNEYKDCD